jgi:23S rRNA pseudouridine2605 synthase
MVERVQKILSQYGIASRRQAEQMILAGRVRLNGAIATLGQKADPTCDRIEVDGEWLQPCQRPPALYLLMHKPAGVVSTCQDPWARHTVLDLLPSHLATDAGLHPVGRLDADSTGALLLTNDGELTFALTHPSHSIAKTYQVWLQGAPPEAVLDQWRRGVVLAGKPTRPAEVRIVRSTRSQTLLEIVLREGRNRQIRRIAEQLGYEVTQLHRISIGPIHLDTLVVGKYRSLTTAEINFLNAQIKPVSPSTPNPTVDRE